MLTADGCRERRRRLLKALPELPKPLVLADASHLQYLANCYITPINLAGDFRAALVIRGDGSATLIHDASLPASVKRAHVDEVVEVPWYDFESPARCPRQLAIVDKLPAAPADSCGSPTCRTIVEAVTAMRRRKDPDEIAAIKQCCRVAEAGHDWGFHNVCPGMSEMDVYANVVGVCERVAGEPVVVYGDFAVSTGPERTGGPPTNRVLKKGDLMILDFSVVLGGYRSDFTNTVCVGGEPNADQQCLMTLCQLAMAAGENRLKAGASCQSIYDAVHGIFAKAGLGEWFPHHAGHGLGLMHPEPPFFVKHSNETLVANDIVTLEPGLYLPGVGGVRIEHNYCITADGYEKLSRHRISLGVGLS